MTNEKGYSCSSLTMALLEVGGLKNLVSDVARKVVSPTSNFAISPNNLVNQLSLAKIVEEREHPEVLDFKVAQKESSKKESFVLTVKAEKIDIAQALGVANVETATIGNNSTNTFKRS